MSETVYEHISGNDTFTVTAAERWSVGMIRRLKEKYPDQVDICRINQDGTVLAHLPLEWLRIVPKKRCSLSDEHRQALSERMKAIHPRAVHRENNAISKDSTPQVSQVPPDLESRGG